MIGVPPVCVCTQLSSKFFLTGERYGGSANRSGGFFPQNSSVRPGRSRPALEGGGGAGVPPGGCLSLARGGVARACD